MKKLSSDIEYYEILDPMNANKKWDAGDSIKECKTIIDAFQIKVGMPNNLPSSWGKLK